jgi:kynurenine formamidase
MQGGSTEQVFYNGFTAKEMDAPNGLQRLGIEHLKPIITRGVLIDIAAYKGVARLPNSYEVTVADVTGALARQDMSANDIRPGDAVLFRYGWSSLWTQPQASNNNPPGIGVAVARWVAERQVTMIGSDSWGSEVIPNPQADQAFPVHQDLMMRNGILNLENMRFDDLVADRVSEFLFIVTPIRFKGATGSPVRPIAIR